MCNDSEDDARVLTEVERLERDKAIMAGEIRRLARNYVELAGMSARTHAAMSDDSRVRYARAMLTKHKKARRL